MAGTPTRRQVLAACGAVATGGCLGGNDPPLGLRQIEIANATTTDVSIGVTVQKSDRTVYDKVLQLSGEWGERVTQIQCDWMGDRVYYEVQFEAVINGQKHTTSSDSFSLIGDDGDYGETSCFSPHVSVKKDDITIAHDFLDSCNNLETKTPAQ